MAARFDLLLAQLVCSRLCHDLAGLTGAIANGADLVAESPSGADAEALALFGQSARQAKPRIGFFCVVAPSVRTRRRGRSRTWLPCPRVCWPEVRSVSRHPRARRHGCGLPRT